MLERAERVPDEVADIRRDFGASVIGNIIEAAPFLKGSLKRGNHLLFALDLIIFMNEMSYSEYVEKGTGQRGSASWTKYLPDDEPPMYTMSWIGMAGTAFMRQPIAEGLEFARLKFGHLAEGV